jgi:hypothetical protein
VVKRFTYDTLYSKRNYFMIPHSSTDNSIPVIITSITLQAGVWLSDLFVNLDLVGISASLYEFAKLGALIISMWASYRVAVKNKPDDKPTDK